MITSIIDEVWTWRGSPDPRMMAAHAITQAHAVLQLHAGTSGELPDLADLWPQIDATDYPWEDGLISYAALLRDADLPEWAQVTVDIVTWTLTVHVGGPWTAIAAASYAWWPVSDATGYQVVRGTVAEPATVDRFTVASRILMGETGDEYSPSLLQEARDLVEQAGVAPAEYVQAQMARLAQFCR